MKYRSYHGKERKLAHCFGCALFLLPIAGFAESRQVDSHAHGVAELNVAVDGASLQMEYVAPAANITGFEHAATSPAEIQAVEEATSVLLSGRMFDLPEAAGCTLADAAIQEEDHSEDHESHEDDHSEDHESHDDDHSEDHESHGDDHSDDHASDEDVHSEFHVLYQYECRDPAALEHIDVNIFDLFPGNEQIDAQVITATGQGGTELTAAGNRIELP